VLLNREGWKVGKAVMCRLYGEEGMALKQRPKRRRRAAEQRGENALERRQRIRRGVSIL
jgi:putative transposase